METTSNSRAGSADITREIDWSEVYADLLPRVFHYFAYRTGNRQIAEDLTSTTFERAWRRRSRYQRELGKFTSWVFGIARRVGFEHFRKQRDVKAMEQVEQIPSGVRFESELDKQEDFERLSRLLEFLDERERELLAFKYGAGLNNREIAKSTGLSESNVGTILHRVVSKLKNLWEAEDE